jgi:hypothetical protein
MARFDWETEEEVEDASLHSAAVPSKRRWRRVWLTLAVVFVAVAATTVWQLNRRVEARADLVEQDVTAAFELWTEAIVQADADILNTLLIGNETVWASTQRRMLASGSTLDRKMLGMSLRDGEDDRHFTLSSVDLAPDWQGAQIFFEPIYDLGQGDGEEATVRLQQAVSFKRINGRWFLTRPDDSFWGEWSKEEGRHLSIEFPKRDEDIVGRLRRDLEAEMADACARLTADGRCPEDVHLELRLEYDPRVLTGLTDPDVPLLDGHTFLLPSPSLVGMPTDQEGYEALYQAYAARVLDLFAADLTSPISLPEQKVKILCYQRADSVPRLYQYDVAAKTWSLDIPKRAFRFLSASADDSGLLLQEYHSGRSANRLRVAYITGRQERIVYDDFFSRLASLPVGWGGTAEEPELLFFGFDSSPGSGRLGRIDLDDCPGPDCEVHDLGGFPVWSPDKQKTILTQGDALYLGDSQGQILAEIGKGFSAFWIDSERYGYARYVDGIAGYGAELVMGSVGDDVIHTLLGPHDLAERLLSAEIGIAFVDFISVSPSDRKLLIMSARSYYGDLNRSYIISARLPSDFGESDSGIALDDLRLRLALDGLPRGYPGQIAASGNVPFMFSPDGRWLSLSRLEDPENNLWRVYVHDISADETKSFAARYPLYTFRYPFYDWSADGEWLILVDDGYLRLIAPAYDYRRLILHDLHSCFHVAWVD